jgi:hypothetical protein
MQFKAIQIEGQINCIADVISSKQWQRFGSLLRETDPEMTPGKMDKTMGTNSKNVMSAIMSGFCQ